MTNSLKGLLAGTTAGATERPRQDHPVGLAWPWSRPQFGRLAAPILLGLALCLDPGALGQESHLKGADGESLVGGGLTAEIAASRRGTNVAQDLETLYRKCRNSQEQVEVELTLARFYGQTTGFVDYAKAVEWYDKALVRQLPLTAAAEHFILRGNCHEILKLPAPALADYVRGLLVCLHFNLPEFWPERDRPSKMPQPMMGSFMDGDAARTAARIEENRRVQADFQRNRTMTDEEQVLLRQRYYYVDAIKRVLAHEKWGESDLRAAAERLTNRPDRLEELLQRVRGPNPRPWP